MALDAVLQVSQAIARFGNPKLNRRSGGVTLTRPWAAVMRRDGCGATDAAPAPGSSRGCDCDGWRRRAGSHRDDYGSTKGEKEEQGAEVHREGDLEAAGA